MYLKFYSMKRFSSFILMIALLAMYATSCSNSNSGVRGVKHVLMIGLDGLAGNTVEAADMPTVKMMMAEGAWTLQARSILPSSSACNWGMAADVLTKFRQKASKIFTEITVHTAIRISATLCATDGLPGCSPL